MVARHMTLTAAAFLLVIPALAQDARDADADAAAPLRATGGAYPARQGSNQWLGSNLIGAKVVSASNEAIGRIANLVINDDGAIVSAVIAVGGVLGVGSKEVAVTFKSLNITRTKAGDVIDHVTLTATRDDLRHAAEFKTLSQQMAERHAQR